MKTRAPISRKKRGESIPSFNGAEEKIRTVESLGIALDRFDKQHRFELWASLSEGSSLCMLRNGEHAFLIYLRFPGDSGFVSGGKVAADSVIEYQLSNGQLDEYPASWCISTEQCYKAIAYFFVNQGRRPEWLAWHAH
jgi:hypothetical protein